MELGFNFISHIPLLYCVISYFTQRRRRCIMVINSPPLGRSWFAHGFPSDILAMQKRHGGRGEPAEGMTPRMTVSLSGEEDAPSQLWLLLADAIIWQHHWGRNTEGWKTSGGKGKKEEREEGRERQDFYTHTIAVPLSLLQPELGGFQESFWSVPGAHFWSIETRLEFMGRGEKGLGTLGVLLYPEFWMPPFACHYILFGIPN